jgi:hypothetical protein
MVTQRGGGMGEGPAMVTGHHAGGPAMVTVQEDPPWSPCRRTRHGHRAPGAIRTCAIRPSPLTVSIQGGRDDPRREHIPSLLLMTFR